MYGWKGLRQTQTKLDEDWEHKTAQILVVEQTQFNALIIGNIFVQKSVYMAVTNLPLRLNWKLNGVQGRL